LVLEKSRLSPIANDLKRIEDPALFCRQRLRLEPDEWQKDFLRDRSDRIIMNCSRQVGKSTMTAVKALHRARYDRGSLILLLSPALRQSLELFKKVNDFSILLGIEKIDDSKQYMSLKNGSRIVSLPGKGGTVRGYSPDLLIVDEAGFVSDELFYAIDPMVAVTKGDIILLSTPNGKRGFFYNIFTTDNRWKKYEIPATVCPRISKKFLAEKKATLPERVYLQEYFCQFVETEDQVFTEEDWEDAVDSGLVPMFSDDEFVDDEVKPIFEGV